MADNINTIASQLDAFKLVFLTPAPLCLYPHSILFFPKHAFNMPIAYSKTSMVSSSL